MTVSWSSHAKGQRAAILRTIARELSREDASRWHMKIREAVQHLADFPEAGDSIPETCFSSVPADIERLRQTLCNPYRIVYETVGNQIRILAIMHSRMLVWSSDTRWA